MAEHSRQHLPMRPSAWKSAQRHWHLPTDLRSWLLDEGSLTARLQELSNGAFRVQVLSQQLALPNASEQRRLGLRTREQALVREVILMGHEQPWVFARSLLPLTSLTGPLRCLYHLQDRPLGAFLFSQPDMTRDQIEVAALAPGQYLPASLTADTTLWGRRSVFRVAGRPLLVSEVFLKPFVDYLQHNR